MSNQSFLIFTIYALNRDGQSFLNILNDPEITANLYCNLRICIEKVAWFVVYICGNLWTTQYSIILMLTWNVNSADIWFYWILMKLERVRYKFDKDMINAIDNNIIEKKSLLCNLYFVKIARCGSTSIYDFFFSSVTKYF